MFRKKIVVRDESLLLDDDCILDLGRELLIADVVLVLEHVKLARRVSL